METWHLDEERHFNNIGKKKQTVDYGPMGPNHPGWADLLWETENMLKQAGRVYDRATIEAISLNENAWEQLSKDAIQNIMEAARNSRFEELSNTLGRVRKEAKSQKRLDDLFGEPTVVK